MLVISDGSLNPLLIDEGVQPLQTGLAERVTTVEFTGESLSQIIRTVADDTVQFRLSLEFCAPASTSPSTGAWDTDPSSSETLQNELIWHKHLRVFAWDVQCWLSNDWLFVAKITGLKVKVQSQQ